MFRVQSTAVLAAVAGLACSAMAQDISWINPDGGTWGDSANWDPINVPDALGENAIIDLAGVYTVSLDLSSTIGELHLPNPDARLDINAARTLTLTGATNTNDGLIVLNPQNNAADALLRFDETGTLDGTGEVHMLSPGNNSRIETAVDQMILHAATHTIRGVGQINADMVNDGDIIADASIALAGTDLDIMATNKINNGRMIALTGSFLDIGDITIDQTGGGQLLADAGTVRTSSSTILSGTIDSLNAGVYSTQGGTTTLGTLTINAPTMLNAATTIAITGTGLTNNAVMDINPQNSAADALLRFDETGTLDGTGEVHMLSQGNNSQLKAAGGVTITQGPDHTVSGIGQINAPFINNGTVGPGLSAGTLTVNNTFTNTTTGVIDIELAGTSNTQFDRMVGTGTYTLGGTLRISTIDAFDPALNDIFTIIEGTSVTGEFEFFDVPNLPNLRVFGVIYNPDSVVLRVTCAADLNFNGVVDADDFFLYLDFFATDDDRADITGNGTIDADDFFAYLDLFAGDCL